MEQGFDRQAEWERGEQWDLASYDVQAFLAHVGLGNCHATVTI